MKQLILRVLIAATVILPIAFAVNPAQAQNMAVQFGGTFYANIVNSSGISILNFTADSFTLEACLRPSSFALVRVRHEPECRTQRKCYLPSQRT